MPLHLFFSKYSKIDMFHPLLQLCIVQLFGGIDQHCQHTYLTKLRLCNTCDSDAFRQAVDTGKLAQACAPRKYKRQLQERLQQGSND